MGGRGCFGLRLDICVNAALMMSHQSLVQKLIQFILFLYLQKIYGNGTLCSLKFTYKSSTGYEFCTSSLLKESTIKHLQVHGVTGHSECSLK